MPISAAGVSAYDQGKPAEVTVLAGQRGPEGVHWLGTLTLCEDGYVHILAQPSEQRSHFWLHQRPGEQHMALEGYDGRFVVMWFRRLAARSLTSMNLEWQCFACHPSEQDAGAVMVGDKERTGKFLAVEPPESTAMPSPGQRLAFSEDQEAGLLFKFVVTAAQRPSPGETLLHYTSTRDSRDDRLDMKFVKCCALVRASGAGVVWGQKMLPGLQPGDVDFAELGQLLEAVETSQHSADKVACLVQVRAELERRGAAAGLTVLGADEMMPLLVLCLVWSPLIEPQRHMLEMGLLLEDSEDSMQQYMYACFCAAVQFITHDFDPNTHQTQPEAANHTATE